MRGRELGNSGRRGVGMRIALINDQGVYHNETHLVAENPKVFTHSADKYT